MILKALVTSLRIAWTWLVAGPVTTAVWILAELVHLSPRGRPII